MRPLTATIWTSIAIALALVGAGSVGGQQPFVVEAPPNASYPDYKQGSSIASRLRRAPAKMFTFDRASLRDVLRYLADDAGLPFVGMPETDSANKRLVTFTMESSPFTALESVCRENGVRLSYDNGVWFMRSVDEERERRVKEEEENKLVGIAYKLVYDPVERVDFRSDTGGTSAASPTAGASQANGSATTTPNLPLQSSQRVFQSKSPRIVNEIRVMLGLAPITYGPDGSPVYEAEKGTTVQSTTASAAPTEPNAASSLARLNPTYVPPQTPQVIYNSDNNTLWVVATRQQHKWVADYLLAVDKPQALIAIEIKFLETQKKPSKQLGIDWTGTMANGYTVAATGIKASPTGDVSLLTGRSGGASYGTGRAGSAGGPAIVSGGPVIAGGVAQTSAGVPIPSGLETVWGTTLTAGAPYQAVLNAGDIALTLRAFMDDPKTTLVQYPRLLTVNNREVAITAADNTPINTGVVQVQSGSTATPTGTLGWLPIGTQINILPKTVGKDQIALTVAITISSPTGSAPVNLGAGSQNIPTTSSRMFNASLQVNSGYTLAIGGLEKLKDDDNRNGIPFLQNIPGVGEAFRSKVHKREKVNLIIFITPTIITNSKNTNGISDPPEAVIPIRPDNPVPPSFTPDGRLVGGAGAIDAALAWLDFQIRYFRQINKEQRTEKETLGKLRGVIGTARMLAAEIALLQEQTPSKGQELSRKEDRAISILTELNKVLSVAQNNIL